MNVRELIELLQGFPGETPVGHMRDDFAFDVVEAKLEPCTRTNHDHFAVCYYPEVEEEPVVNVVVLRG